MNQFFLVQFQFLCRTCYTYRRVHNHTYTHTYAHKYSNTRPRTNSGRHTKTNILPRLSAPVTTMDRANARAHTKLNAPAHTQTHAYTQNWTHPRTRARNDHDESREKRKKTEQWLIRWHQGTDKKEKRKEGKGVKRGEYWLGRMGIVKRAHFKSNTD